MRSKQRVERLERLEARRKPVEGIGLLVVEYGPDGEHLSERHVPPRPVRGVFDYFAAIAPICSEEDHEPTPTP